MEAQMVTHSKPQLSPWRRGLLALLAAGIVWLFVDSQGFLNLWLTPDQQGRLWFELGDYQRAAKSFENPQWRGFSLYASEDFEHSELLFSQFHDANSLLARANSLAHQGDYLGAKQGYLELAKQYPKHPALAVNLPVMDKLIEITQKSPNSDAKDKSGRRNQPGSSQEASAAGEGQAVELEQYSAEQLLQDPGLTDLWLRQIQRDPSEFMITKFYLQLEQEEAQAQEALDSQSHNKESHDKEHQGSEVTP